MEQYYIRDDHEAIIKRDIWDAVQDEIKRRQHFNAEHGVQERVAGEGGQFNGRVFCEKCGGKFKRRYWKGIRAVFWKCENTGKDKEHICCAGNIRESDLKEAFVIAWNRIVDNRDGYLPIWQKDTESEDRLKRLRAKQMIELTAEERLIREVPELTRMLRICKFFVNN